MSLFNALANLIVELEDPDQAILVAAETNPVALERIANILSDTTHQLRQVSLQLHKEAMEPEAAWKKIYDLSGEVLHQIENDNLQENSEKLQELLQVAQDLKNRMNQGESCPEGVSQEGGLDTINHMATLLEECGMVKQASVFDELLLSIAAPKGEVEKVKGAKDKEIEKYRGYQTQDKFDQYNRREEAKKLLSEGVKAYRSMEMPLSTRTCPDHPGAQMMRVEDDTYQCQMDKGIYNYRSGFTTMKGNVVPGGDVSNQSYNLFDRPGEHTSFDSRESRLNQ